ncbi:ABC-type multidrug transport system, ATPase component [Desulfocapsa sulfexigens DSM 10523]|uniref:ABC-type multidrug transport system, ATPase component n=1 Tax=Desulfocapsa sulfexigens (strain DSM 10523 / SB164P1) TaxID=1167006 RepID=M1PF71_DESSD|nr:ABC transporter ATP-binding protein [Desulfocapsa sulfexigens]AGF78340.1 ABC-type multidrug transport system, ATPase component [Desulfocapsa sulfexigens DSM 10523]
MLPAIELHNISKTFTERNWKTFLFRKPRQTLALDNVSLTVEKGTIMGLLGPNGAGKTTLIKILSTLVTPDSGEGSISGLSLATQSLAIRNKIGLVSTNDRTFYWRLTGRENLDFFATLYNLHGSVKAERINKALQLTGMEDKADSRFMSYSSGQKQRLAIARAMLSDPEVLLMDEATTSLDPIATRKLLTFTKETLARQEQKTIIWCTHNLHEAEEICDHATILHKGKVLYSGKLEEMSDSGSQNIELAFSNLVDFFQNSPLAGAGINTTRDNSI